MIVKSKKTFKSKGRIYCLVCAGNPKNGKCLVCGFGTLGVKQEKEKNHQDYRLEWLKETWKGLKKYSQATTGNFDLDSEIIKEYGLWQSNVDRLRGLKVFLTAHCMETTGKPELDLEIRTTVGQWDIEHSYDETGKCVRCSSKKEVLDVPELMALIRKGGII